MKTHEESVWKKERKTGRLKRNYRSLHFLSSILLWGSWLIPVVSIKAIIAPKCPLSRKQRKLTPMVTPTYFRKFPRDVQCHKISEFVSSNKERRQGGKRPIKKVAERRWEQGRENEEVIANNKPLKGERKKIALFSLSGLKAKIRETHTESICICWDREDNEDRKRDRDSYLARKERVKRKLDENRGGIMRR